MPPQRYRCQQGRLGLDRTSSGGYSLGKVQEFIEESGMLILVHVWKSLGYSISKLYILYCSKQYLKTKVLLYSKFENI